MIEKPRMVKIKEVRKECRDIKTLFFDESLNVDPGQFMMVWIPSLGEKPFSLSYRDAFTVKEVGSFTQKLGSLKIGDKIGIRGPYGHGFSLKEGKVLIIGGGIGVAPLRLLGESLKARVFSILGFRTKQEVFLASEFKRFGQTVILTDDGSYGQKGTPPHYIKDKEVSSYDYYYACGPEPMMKKVLEIMDIPGEYSLERYMKCGLGICGACSFGPFRVCKDGPVLKSSKLKDIPDFGKFRYNRTGKRVNF